MGRIFNKIVRKAIKIFSGELSQDLNGGNSGEKCVIDGFDNLLRRAGAEGCVLLKNDGTLPITDKKVAVFGRVQYDYFCVGYGSGGDVVTPYRINLIDGLINGGLRVDDKLAEEYKKWIEKPKNEADEGFWGNWPYSFREMPLDKGKVSYYSENNDVALIVIGRAAGEDRENKLKEGSYYLTKAEKDMLSVVTEYFDKVVVLLNIGNVMDMEWVEEYGDKISSLMISWQGGMESGNSVCDVLKGTVSPSGKLSDTIAKKYEYYPSQNFGNRDYNEYTEDIFVGYRYFETFARDRVLYPFGYGLSYTEFRTELLDVDFTADPFAFRFSIKNTGNCSGSNIIQLYCEQPQGKFGKAKRILVAFDKTAELAIGECEEVTLTVSLSLLSSFDDTGKSGFVSSFVLEEGKYKFYYGEDCRCDNSAGIYYVNETYPTERLHKVLAVKKDRAFNRMIAQSNGENTTIAYEKTPTDDGTLKKRILSSLPQDIPYIGDKGYKLIDVKEGKASLDDFLAQLTDEELEALVRGEGGMNSSLGVVGNAGAIGGTIESLREKGIPAVITTDGPAGIRIKKTCALLPCGTALACTWNKKLIEEVYSIMGKEMQHYGSHVILSPGMNIHRNPLCGRNFEYYSEDPFLSGIMAKHAILGVQSQGVSACPKHFACNSQETNRQRNDSIVSERALREIYLKGFEIAVKEGRPHTIMTSYNKINGVWSHYNYDLCTMVLRDEWGYDGLVMTDWWMQYAPSPEFPNIESNAYRVRAQVDVLMPGVKRRAVNKKNKNDGTLLKTLGEKEGITRGEILRSARNVLKFVMKSAAIQ